MTALVLESGGEENPSAPQSGILQRKQPEAP